MASFFDSNKDGKITKEGKKANFINSFMNMSIYNIYQIILKTSAQFLEKVEKKVWYLAWSVTWYLKR